MWKPKPLRRFFNTQDAPPDSRPSDSYFEKLQRYIPADIITAFVFLDGILHGLKIMPDVLPRVVFGILLFLTPFYVVFMKTDPPGFAPSKTFHWVASVFAFTVYAFAIDSVFAQTFTWYNPVYGSIALVLTTLILPLAERLFIRFVGGPGTNPSSPSTGPASGPTTPPVTSPSTPDTK